MNSIMKAGLVLAVAAPLQAFAVTPTVSWTAWSSASNGTLTQDAQAVNVSYVGETLGVDYSSAIYDVPGSFTFGAEVTNTPGANGTIDMQGGGADVVNTFHFDRPVLNPYVVLFSVGQSGVPVRFEFQDGNISLLSQGSGHWGGGTLTLSGQTVTGFEGNGLLRFNGTYTDISFITPDHEYYYGATVGAAVAAVPEPASYGMLLAGLGMLGLAARRRLFAGKA